MPQPDAIMKRGPSDLNGGPTKVFKISSEGRKDDQASEADLCFIYDEIEVHPKSQGQLKEQGICCIGDLLKNQENLEAGTVGNVRENVQTQLFHFCLWYEDFHKESHSTSWKESFTWDAFEKFEEKLKDNGEKVTGSSKLEDLFSRAVETIHDGNPAVLEKLTEHETVDLFHHIVDTVYDRLPQGLIDVCQFDVKALVHRCIKAIFNLPTGDPYPKIQLVAGRTQSGKSHVKAVVQATCDLLDCPLIILTKGVAESKDLAKKLESLLTYDQSEVQKWIKGINRHSKSNVIADTAARIASKAIKMVKQLRDIKPKGKFVVIVDECDAMYRTEERSQKMEQAFDNLMDLQPALRIEISATPIPALLYIGGELGRQVEMLELGTSDDYCGITQMVPLKDKKGSNQYLNVSSTDMRREFKLGVPYIRKKKLSLKLHDNDVLFKAEEEGGRPFEFQAKVFAKGERLKTIPYTDESVMDLYEDAMGVCETDISKRQGTLLLDCTNNRVWAEENIFQKASCVQNCYHRLGKKMVVICVVGNGIYFRRPGFTHGRKVNNQKTVSEVLQQLDKEFGLSIPFFVFGFSKMRRCISFRSDSRVPTHMVLNLGLGQSNESFIQAIGRATFNGLETVLKKNGYHSVTVLAPKRDLKMAQRYTNFVHEVSQKLTSGEASTESVMKDGMNRFTDSANYIRFSNRKTGQMKGLQIHLPDQDTHFEDPDDDESVVESTVLSESIVHRVKSSVFYLVTETETELSWSSDEDDSSRPVERLDDDDSKWKKINAKGFTISQIQDKYNDTFQEDGHSIKRGELTKILNQLKSEARLEKTHNGGWRAKNWVELRIDCKYVAPRGLEKHASKLSGNTAPEN
jgi:hypothetical protein